MMTPEERKARLKAIEEEKEILQAEEDLRLRKSNITRSRSVTVGTAFGGITEVSMRGDGELYLWCLLQPVEVTELIHQLASNIGCHINLQPRKDFASWREWKTDQGLLEAPKHAPMPNNMDAAMNIGASLPPAQSQSGLPLYNFSEPNATFIGVLEGIPPELSQMQNKQDKIISKTKRMKAVNNESLAATKTINKRKSKRTTGTA